MLISAEQATIEDEKCPELMHYEPIDKVNSTANFHNRKLFISLRALTRALKGFFLQFKPAFWWMSINSYMVFHALTKSQRRFFPRFSSTRKNMTAFKPFLQYLALGSDTASCQDLYLLIVCRRKLKLSTYLRTVN